MDLEPQTDLFSHHLSARMLFLVLSIPVLLLPPLGPAFAQWLTGVSEKGAIEFNLASLTQSPRVKQISRPERVIRAACGHTTYFQIKNLTQKTSNAGFTTQFPFPKVTCHCDVCTSVSPCVKTGAFQASSAHKIDRGSPPRDDNRKKLSCVG